MSTSRFSPSFLQSLLILPFLLSWTSACSRCNETVMAVRVRLEHDSVVPDVIDTAPNDTIRIKYPEPSNVSVDLGNELAPREVKEEPWDIYWSHDGSPETLYTLAMVDPDAPSRVSPSLGQVLHWLVVNIPLNRIGSGKKIAEYRGSGPPEGSGLHRYVFLVYKQRGRIESEEPVIRKTARTGRLHFKIRDFANRHDLGEPIAANYFQAQYDDYVPIMRAETTD